MCKGCAKYEYNIKETTDTMYKSLFIELVNEMRKSPNFINGDDEWCDNFAMYELDPDFTYDENLSRVRLALDNLKSSEIGYEEEKRQFEIDTNRGKITIIHDGLQLCGKNGKLHLVNPKTGEIMYRIELSDDLTSTGTLYSMD